ncbi:MAG: hypothetical protein GKR93_16380 [Gammaproteobacteria bacterium]|nr:hypothetical protein [Gammaproteobacteria bacterium]
MNEQIRHLMAQITELEDDLHKLIQEQQAEFNYRLEGTKVKFEKSIQEAQRQLKTGYIKFLRQSQPRNIISAPIIYSVFIPFFLLDVWVTVYQYLCFPLYRIPRVKRSMYIVIDRHHLRYLNSIERFNCIYCGYAGGVISYVREVAARTEQYWCPIKHARKILDPHRRYARFADFGQADGYADLLQEMRNDLRTEKPGNG